MRHLLIAAFTLTALLPCHTYAQLGDASVAVRAPSVTTEPLGQRTVHNVELATPVASYTLRYDIIDLPDEPGRVAFQKWAPAELGYVPLGIASPSMANWYNQGFFIWTFDELNIQDYKAGFRVIREFGDDAMVEYVWDTPKVRAVARFAITSGSDKLLMFGSWEPKEEIKSVKLRLMCYPATFSKPWVRSITTAVRTLSEGSGVPVDPATERWVLFEDTQPGRPGDGSAGLLLGDSSVFDSVTLDGIGGYAEYTNISVKPQARKFALGFYESPAMPDYKQTRDYFARQADAESEALARMLEGDLDEPLSPLPVDAQRAQKVARADEERIDRPAEAWSVPPEPLAFPWASQIPGDPVKAALLPARWAAYDTMELARRLEMDVKHQYFDTKDTISNPNTWPYRHQTGIGTLGVGLAARNALRICSDPDRDVLIVAGLSAAGIPKRVRNAILSQVRQGKGLVLTGGGGVLNGWPAELTQTPDDNLAGPALAAVAWSRVPGFREGERGRIGAGPPLAGYRYGKGRVLVFKANVGRYLSLLPLSDQTFGLDAADDHLLALHAAAVLAAADRQLPVTVNVQAPEQPLPVAAPAAIPISIAGGRVASALTRVQDDHGVVVASDEALLDQQARVVNLPPLPAGREYYVDLLLRDDAGDCAGYASTMVRVEPSHTIEAVELSPAAVVHETAPPMVDLVDGGTLTCLATVAPAAQADGLTVRWDARDCFGRVLATGNSPVQADGSSRAQLRMSAPVTVYHELEATLLDGEKRLALHREIFTVPVPYEYGDFTYLMWSYARSELPVRIENRLCYEMGSDMMDLCHMRGYSDESAAREYAVAARCGQRLVPYVTRIANAAQPDNTLSPGLFNEEWVETQRKSMQVCCRQAVPYKPPAYTLGDENYMARGNFEVEVSPASTEAFREWLRERYATIDELNAAWHTELDSFEAIDRPTLLEEAATREDSFAAWFDFREFMDDSFVRLHERLADYARAEDPGAKVGWDGLLGYHWQAGYDFHKLAENLELNQCYTTQPFQGELIRSFKRPDALTGEWGNAIADKEDGFTAIGWHNLFKGHNSCWWWTSWGCDYIPFNPDMTVSHMGRWFFEEAQRIKAGPGRLLVHADRDDSGIAILYSQADMYASVLAATMSGKDAYAGGRQWLTNHDALRATIEDLGCQYRYVAAAQLEAGPGALEGYRVLLLPSAVCLSDRHVEAIREFVAGGGLVIADGRAGILTGNGILRADRPLDELFGVASQSGLAALSQEPRPVELTTAEESVTITLLEPGLQTTVGQPARVVDGEPLLVMNRAGEGGTALLNAPFTVFTTMQGSDREQALGMLTAVLGSVGVKPYATLKTPEGRAKSVEQALFTEGDLRYLCLEQNILARGLPGQQCRLTIEAPAYVYDVRAGQAVGTERIASWDVDISRGNPRLFALLPYRVTGVDISAPPTARAADGLTASVTIRTTGGAAQRHVAHLSVFAPGSDTEHRQYSRNIDCPAGEGKLQIPFALSDPTGTWRLRVTDAATGVSSEVTVRLQP